MFEGCCCNAEGQDVETIGPISGTDESYNALPVQKKEKQSEKDRLAELTSNFARQAVKGMKCTFMQDGGDTCIQTQYRVTQGLDSLLVMSPSQADKVLIACPLALIQDVYTYMEDGPAPFQGEWLRKVDAAGFNRDMLLMIVYSHATGLQAESRFCLLLEGRERRDTFLECLRILCVYALNRQAR